jgi:high-affinity Fe2+/Pb2+ permease
MDGCIGSGAGFINSSLAAWAVLGGCGLVALALGVISTSSWAKAAAARNGQRILGEKITQKDRPREVARCHS